MRMAANLKSNNKKISRSQKVFKIELSNFQYLKDKIYPQVTDFFFVKKRATLKKNIYIYINSIEKYYNGAFGKPVTTKEFLYIRLKDK